MHTYTLVVPLYKLRLALRHNRVNSIGISSMIEESLPLRVDKKPKMKIAALLTSLPSTPALAITPDYARDGDPFAWLPAEKDDCTLPERLRSLVSGNANKTVFFPTVRGPCPMMNTLANHGYLPRDGRNITKPNAVHALTTALNFNTSLAELMFEQAIIANPEPNATFFTL